MRAVRKQAMDGLSGASLRRHRSCGLVPLQGEHFSLVTFFCCLGQKKVTRPRQRTEALDLDVALTICGQGRNNRYLRGRDSRRSYKGFGKQRREINAMRSRLASLLPRES